MMHQCCLVGCPLRREHEGDSLRRPWCDPAYRCHSPWWWSDYSHSSQSSVRMWAHSWAQSYGACLPGGGPGTCHCRCSLYFVSNYLVESSVQGIKLLNLKLLQQMTCISKQLSDSKPLVYFAVSCISSRWNLWCVEQKAWSCDWGDQCHGNTNAPYQGIPACHGVIW